MALIDRAIVARLLGEREATITGNGLVYVPRGRAEPDPESAVPAWFRRFRIAMRRLGRQQEAASAGADVAMLTIEYAVAVSEKIVNPEKGGSSHAPDTFLQQLVTALTQTALVDAATSHTIHLDAPLEDEMPAPDEQRGIVVYRLTITGTVQRTTGSSVAVFPAEVAP